MALSPFLFGKLPTHGDFIARGLGAEAERIWDDWASGEIESARVALGEDFDAAHDAAPPWGFIGGPGPLGEGWRCGAVAASVDSAGRRFLIVAGHDGLTDAQAAFTGLNGALSCETAIRGMLTEGLDADGALAMIAGLAPSPETLSAAPLLGAQAGSGLWWAFGDIIPPVGSNPPAPGFVAAGLGRIATLLREAA